MWKPLALPAAVLGIAIVVPPAHPASADIISGYRSVAKSFARTSRNSGISSIAVLPFTPVDDSGRKEGLRVSEELTTRIVRSRKIRVIERTLLQPLLEEHRLSRSGAISQEGLVQLGAVARVEAVVLGTYSTDGDHLVINARLVRLKDGTILDARRIRVKRSASPYKPGFYNQAMAVAANAEQSERSRLDPASETTPGASALPELLGRFLGRTAASPALPGLNHD